MNANRRLLTQSNSRLAKVDIIKLLADESAWSSLSLQQQIALYALLPMPEFPQRQPLDPTIHPFRTEYAPHIKHFVHEWQNDLREGRNTQKWRNEAMQASGERAAGVFDDVLAWEREERWGAAAAAAPENVIKDAETGTASSPAPVNGHAREEKMGDVEHAQSDKGNVKDGEADSSARVGDVIDPGDGEVQTADSMVIDSAPHKLGKETKAAQANSECDDDQRNWMADDEELDGFSSEDE